MIQPTPKHQVTWPKETHWRRATCAEVDCPRYLLGWVTTVAIGSPQHDYIANELKNKERHAISERVGDELMQFSYPPGQRCFGANHWRKLDRGPWLTVGSPGLEAGRLERLAMEPERWVENYNREADRYNYETGG